MTAINIIVQRSRALVMTDAATIDETGRVVAIEPKGVEIPHMRGFMVTAGNVQVGKVVMDMIELFHDIDDFAENGRACAESRSRYMVERWPHMFDVVPFSVHLIGWSEPKRAPRYVSFHWNMDGFNFWADDTSWFSPSCDAAVHDAFRESIRRQGGVEHFNPRRDGLALMQMQRRQRLEAADWGCLFVGGSMQLVTISEGGVERQTLWRWADEVGKPIVPIGDFDGEIVASAAPGSHLSRRERRAITAKNRRAA